MGRYLRPVSWRCPRCFAGVTPGERSGAAPALPVIPACQIAPARTALTHLAAAAATVEAVTNQQAAGQQETDKAAFYPGRLFGLPEAGAGSVAGWSRRLGALFIDWLLCSVIAIAFLYHPSGPHGAAVLTEPRLWTPVIFAVEDILLTGLTGITIGKRLVGLRVVRLDGRPVGIVRAVIRTVLLMLVVPAMMMDRDLRGLHDKAAGTVVVQAR